MVHVYKYIGIYVKYINMHTHTYKTYNGFLFSHKNEKNLAICDNMDGSWGHYANCNKSDRERQISMISLILEIKIKKKKKQTHTEDGLMVARGKEWGVGEMGKRGQIV